VDNKVGSPINQFGFALSTLLSEQEKVREQLEETNEQSEKIQFELVALEGKDAQLTAAIEKLKGKQ